MKFFLSLLTLILIITACTKKDKYAENVKNTYYIEVSADTAKLQDTLIKVLDGKISYHKNNKLEIASINYLTKTYPDIHYYKFSSLLPKDIEKGTLKIVLKVTGKMATDSTVYTLPRFRYNGKDWEKVSDIGPIEMRLDGLTKREKFHFYEIINEIRTNVVNSTYN